MIRFPHHFPHHFPHNHGFRFAVLAAALLLGSCAALQPTKPFTIGDTAMPELPFAASADVSAEIAIERWWTSFNDDVLDTLMSEALANNADLAIAMARVSEARADLDIAGASLWPTLDLRLGTQRERRSEVGPLPLPKGFDTEVSDRNAVLQTSYEVDLWGRVRATNASARQQLLATEWARAGVEWMLTAQLADTYFSLAAVQRQLAISMDMLAGRQEAVALYQQEFDAGAGNELTLRRAEAELEVTEVTLARFERQQVALQRALFLLLGRAPQELENRPIVARNLDESQALMNVLPQGELADLLQQRPDLREAEAQLTAGNAAINAARAAAMPAVRLTGSLGSDAQHLADLFSSPAGIWSLAASVTQSLVDGGRASAYLRGEEARAEQLFMNYRKTLANAVLDVQEAYSALDLSQAAWQAETARVTALSRASDIARIGFDNGALNYLELLDAERNLYQAQLDKVGAYRDQLGSQIAAFKALGGGHAFNSTIALGNP